MHLKPLYGMTYMKLYGILVTCHVSLVWTFYHLTLLVYSSGSFILTVL